MIIREGKASTEKTSPLDFHIRNSGEFSWLMINAKGPAFHCRWYQPWAGESRWLKRKAWLKIGDMANKQCPFTVSASVSVSGFLPWVPDKLDLATIFVTTTDSKQRHGNLKHGPGVGETAQGLGALIILAVDWDLVLCSYNRQFITTSSGSLMLSSMFLLTCGAYKFMQAHSYTH